MYIVGLQGHGGLCVTNYDADMMRFITDLIPPAQYNKILDIGAGEGRETLALKNLGYTPTGIITGEDNKKWAKENCPGIEFIDCDMHDLPFPSNSFDAVYMNQVFEHAFAPFIFLIELYCVLRPNGLMYLKMPEFQERHVPNDPTTMEASWISHHHPNMVSPNILRQMFEKTGFIVKKEDPKEMSFLLQKGPELLLHGSVAQVVRLRDTI
jgi:ubiquinone/menaquinone biosynthesis C-methylase UbiE